LLQYKSATQQLLNSKEKAENLLILQSLNFATPDSLSG